MLSALNSKNEAVLAFQLSGEEIEELRKTETFTCSCCNEKVLIKKGKKVLKSGKKIINHFSHEKSSDCPNSGESYEHLCSKITIFENLKSFGIEKVFLERTFSLKDKQDTFDKYLQLVNLDYWDLKIDDTFFGKLLNRNIFRPDIIFKVNNDTVAVEVQKSYLPKEDFLLRTLFYKLLGIKVLWVIPNDVLIKNVKIDNNGNRMINLSDFHKELKKYYFGNIYAWDYIQSQLLVYKVENIEGYRTTGNWQDGSQGGRYWQEDGGYNFTYKKLKRLRHVYTQDNIVENFLPRSILRNTKYNQLIDALIWNINIPN